MPRLLSTQRSNELQHQLQAKTTRYTDQTSRRNGAHVQTGPKQGMICTTMKGRGVAAISQSSHMCQGQESAKGCPKVGCKKWLKAMYKCVRLCLNLVFAAPLEVLRPLIKTSFNYVQQQYKHSVLINRNFTIMAFLSTATPQQLKLT